MISAVATKNMPGEIPVWSGLFIIETIGIFLLLGTLKKEQIEEDCVKDTL